jgi:hypothetical protein
MRWAKKPVYRIVEPSCLGRPLLCESRRGCGPPRSLHHQQRRFHHDDGRHGLTLEQPSEHRPAQQSQM